MKTYLKKVSALFIAFVMMLAMSVPAFAAITGASITVNGLTSEATQKVSIYEIYHLDKNNNLWEGSIWANSILDTIDDESQLLSIKDALLEAREGHEAETKLCNEGSTYVDFSNLQAGAYLVVIEEVVGEGETAKTVYSPMIVKTYEYGEDGLIKAKNETVTAKGESFPLTKEEKTDDQIAQVGDIVEYEINTLFPDNFGRDSVIITDDLTGADYYLTGDKAVNNITIGTESFQIDTSDNGNATIVETENGWKMSIDLSSYLVNNAHAGQLVTIKYTVKVNAVDKVTNKAKADHVPGTEPSTNVYTGNLTITKYAEAVEEGTSQVLKDAEFVLYKVGENDKKLYAVIDEKGYVTGNWVENIDDATRVITDDNGKATVKGLDVGTYYFQEVKAPDGYSVNTTDAEGEVKVEKDENGTIIGATGTASMNDTKLTELPSTGGMGTYLFTIVGVVIMAAAAGMLFMKRRGEAE